MGMGNATGLWLTIGGYGRWYGAGLFPKLGTGPAKGDR